MNQSTPGPPVFHCLPESGQIHVGRFGDPVQPSCPLSSPSPLALTLSQHQGLFQGVFSSHEVAKVLEPQIQYFGHQIQGLKEIKYRLYFLQNGRKFLLPGYDPLMKPSLFVRHIYMQVYTSLLC